MFSLPAPPPNNPLGRIPSKKTCCNKRYGTHGVRTWPQIPCLIIRQSCDLMLLYLSHEKWRPILEELPVTEYLPFSRTPMIIQLLGRICFCQRHGQHLVTLGSKREFYRVCQSGGFWAWWNNSTYRGYNPPQQPIYKAIYRGPNSVMFTTIVGAHLNLKCQLWGFTPLEDSENRFMLLKKKVKKEHWSDDHWSYLLLFYFQNCIEWW